MVNQLNPYFIITSKSVRALQREKQIITLSASSLLSLIFFVLIVGHAVHYTANVPPKLGANEESSTYTDQRTVAFEIPATSAQSNDCALCLCYPYFTS